MEKKARKIGRRGLIAGSLAAAGAAALWKYGLDGKSENARHQRLRPNVLLIVLDTARASYFSCYGHGRPTTPRIDKLCTEGTVYRQVFAPDFWTLPSHASLLTGLYPSEAQATSETNRLPTGIPTLAKRLQKNGYQTGSIICNAWVSSERGFGQGFAECVDMWRREEQSISFSHEYQVEQSAVDRSIAWMVAHANKAEPFFHFLNLNIAHMPYDPPAELRERFLTQTCPELHLFKLSNISGMWKHLAGKLELSDNDLHIMRELYEGEIALADHYVDQLIEALAAHKILDNTMVIVTSDHGENIGDHGMIDHLLSMYDTTLHVPLVIRYPERFPPGSVSDDLVSLVDVVPTVLDVCGVPKEECGPHGRWASLCNADRLKRSFVVAENDRPMNGVNLLKAHFPDFDTATIDHPLRTIRTKQHKLIWHVGQGVELYDLNRDPEELKDVANEQTDVRDELHDQIKTWMANLPTERRPDMFESKDSEAIEHLRSLGYVR